MLVVKHGTLLLEVAKEYSLVDGSRQYFKFVVATQEDFAEVERAVPAYTEAGVVCPYIN